MKRILLVLFLCFNVGVSVVQAETDIQNDIYSSDYPDDYDVWVNSTLLNRVLNELSKKLDLEYQLEDMYAHGKINFITSIYSDVPDKISILSLSAEEDFLSIKGLIKTNRLKSKNLNYINLDTTLDSFIYTLASDMPPETVEEVKQEVKKWDFNKEFTQYSFEFPRGVELSISKYDEDSLELIVIKNFDESEKIDENLIYSETPNNQKYVSLETVSFDFNDYIKGQGKTTTKNDIYSEGYTNDYDIWVNSVFINRILNELTKELEFEFTLDEAIISDSGKAPLIEFNSVSKNGFKSIWFLTGDESIYFQALGYSDDLNKMGFDRYMEKMVYILAPDMAENIVDNAMKELQNFDFYNSDGVFKFTFPDGVRFIVSDNAKEGEFYLSINRKFEDYELLYKELIERTEFKQKYTFIDNIEDYNDYLDADYTEILNTGKKMLGDNHTFSAEVLEYIENTDDNSAFALLMRDGDSNKIYQAYFPVILDTPLKFGDEVIIFGHLGITRAYQTVGRGELITPFIMVEELRVIHN